MLNIKLQSLPTVAERGLFAAEGKETCRDRCNSVHLDRCAGVFCILR